MLGRHFQLGGKPVAHPASVERVANGFLNHLESPTGGSHIGTKGVHGKDPKPLLFTGNGASGLIRMQNGLLFQMLENLLVDGQKTLFGTL